MTTEYDALTASELLTALEQAGRLPDRELIRACLERPAELTPGLLEMLARPDDPAWPDDDPRLMAQTHAALLLIAYREPAALPIFGELYRRPDALQNHYVEWLDPELPAYGAAAVPMLTDLLHDSAAPETSRSSAVAILASIAVRHPEERARVIEALRAVLPPLGADGESLVSDGERAMPPELWMWVMAALADLCDTSSEPQIAALFRAELIAEGFFGGLEHYQKQLSDPQHRMWLASHKSTDIMESYEQRRERAAREEELRAMYAERQERAEAQRQASAKILASARPAPSPSSEYSAKPQTYIRAQPKVGRNEPCPCGSGRKYKHCHGK